MGSSGIDTRLPIPSRGFLLAGFFIGMAAVLLSAGLRLDGGDFITLLAVMAGIKPLEIRSRRDSMVTAFLAYILTITSLFVFENLFMTLYLFASVWTTTGVLIHVNDPTGSLGRQMRLAARLVVVAVPLMVLLFLFFPGFRAASGAPRGPVPAVPVFPIACASAMCPDWSWWMNPLFRSPSTLRYRVQTSFTGGASFFSALTGPTGILPDIRPSAGTASAVPTCPGTR
jgi:hypothetical protein